MKKDIGKTRSTPIRNTLVVWAVAAAGVLCITFKGNYYHSPEFWQNLIAGIHNTLFDVLFIGVLIFWLNRRMERRVEIQRYREEIDVWRMDASATTIRKNQISVRRLNENGVYDIDLSRTYLDGIDLGGAKLAGSNLSDARGYQTVFANVDFRDALFDNAYLKEASFVGADLSRAKLRGATLLYADLHNAILRGADLTGANISNTKMNGAIYDSKTKFPYDFDKSEMICKTKEVSFLEEIFRIAKRRLLTEKRHRDGGSAG